MTRSVVSFVLITIILSMTAPIDLPALRPSVPEVHTGTISALAQEYTESQPIEIGTDLEFSTGPWTGSGTPSDPYLIEGLSIQATTSAISIVGTTVHFLISNCILIGDNTADTVGILLDGVTNGHIRNVTIAQMRHGIRVMTSVNNTISNASISDSYYGIQINESNRTTVNQSRMYSNTYGIGLIDARECNLTENVVYGNEVTGILMDADSQNCTAVRNTIGWNGPTATVTSNAVDNGAFNLWSNANESAGNQWSDYIGVGPYEINGTAGSFDLYPGFLVDFIRPTIDSPEDLRLEEGPNPGSIQWNTSDEYAGTYEVYRDGARIVSDIWRGGIVNITVLPDRVGAYNYTLILQDAARNAASDTVYVVVILPMFGGMGTTQIVISSALSVLAVIFVTVLIKKMR